MEKYFDISETIGQMKTILDVHDIRQNILLNEVNTLKKNYATLLKIASRQEMELKEVRRANNSNIQTLCHLLETSKRNENYTVHKSPITKSFFMSQNHMDDRIFYVSP